MQVFFTWLKETSLIYLSYQGEAYTEPYQTSKIEFFILDVRKNYKYDTVLYVMFFRFVVSSSVYRKYHSKKL